MTTPAGPAPIHPTPQRPPSALARLQRGLMGASLLATAVWLVFMWPRSPLWATVGVVLGAWSHAVVLGLECLLSALVNRADSAPPVALTQRLAAWWQEASLTPTIFFWRQPFRWRALPDSALCDGPVAPGPAVVLLHGFVCNRGFWAPWMRALRRGNVPYTSVNLEPVFGSIDEGIGLIEDTVSRAEQLGAVPPVLIGHSMGGLAARAWLASAPGNLSRVSRIITIGSPHHGTWLARWSHVANGRQMRQHSIWLSALAAKESSLHGDQAYAKFVCWYSNADHIVFPASTATLLGADNRNVPGMAHVALGFHPRVMQESLAMLAPASISSLARTAS